MPLDFAYEILFTNGTLMFFLSLSTWVCIDCVRTGALAECRVARRSCLLKKIMKMIEIIQNISIFIIETLFLSFDIILGIYIFEIHKKNYTFFGKKNLPKQTKIFLKFHN